jgi:peptide/nickel transport system permease protein
MSRLASWSRYLIGGTGVAILVGYGVLVVFGLAEPIQWSTGLFAGGVAHGTNRLEVPPFPVLANLDVFDMNARSSGNHLFLLGSDPGGRDLLALIARGSLPSLTLVALAVAIRTVVGTVAGLLMGLGSGAVRTVSRGAGDWLVGFPYLALAILVIDVLAPAGRVSAFAIAMGLVGWRDMAEVVAERIEYVRSQPFAMGAAALGTSGVRFFQLHVMPHLRPALIVEVVLQCSAVLVLLAELAYLQVFIGPVIRLTQPGANSIPLLGQPELGQLLSNSRTYLLYREWAPFLVPAVAIAVLALGFELVGTALRGRWRFDRR